MEATLRVAAERSGRSNARSARVVNPRRPPSASCSTSFGAGLVRHRRASMANYVTFDITAPRDQNFFRIFEHRNRRSAFPNPRLRRGAPTRPPQNRRDPSKMTHTFFALTIRLLISFMGPFACSRDITGRKSGYSFDTEHTVACASRQRLREVSPPRHASRPKRGVVERRLRGASASHCFQLLSP